LMTRGIGLLEGSSSIVRRMFKRGTPMFFACRLTS
jgi:hypothetical protein